MGWTLSFSRQPHVHPLRLRTTDVCPCFAEFLTLGTSPPLLDRRRGVSAFSGRGHCSHRPPLFARALATFAAAATTFLAGASHVGSSCHEALAPAIAEPQENAQTSTASLSKK